MTEPTTKSWIDEANCAGVSSTLFFPVLGPDKIDDGQQAKEVRRSCAVRVECLEFAVVEREDFGIWGGTNEKEPRVLRRRARQLGLPVSVVVARHR